MATRPLSLSAACAQYVNRYTADHVPAWANKPCEGNGLFYAPQFASDVEWYNNTRFYGETGHIGKRGDCFTSGQTWPFGNWLREAYRIGVTPVQISNLDASYIASKMVLEDAPDDNSDMFVSAANELYASNELEFDEKPVVSIGDGGAFVQCWRWVTNKEAGLADDDSTEYTAVEVDGEQYEFDDDSVCFKRDDGDFEFWFYHRQAEPTAEVITTLIRAANADQGAKS